MSEQINGSIVKVLYYNEDNGYTVALFELNYKNKQNTQVKSRIYGSSISIVGYFDHSVYVGEEFVITGDFIKDKTYGLQFKFQSFERVALNNEHGVIAYLASDLFPGVGIKIAKMIVEKLGINAIELIKNNPDVLDEVNINSKLKSIIYSGIISDQANQQTTIFLLDNGITIDTANKIIKKLGTNIIDDLKENPYILMDTIERFGFKRNDQFALNLGIKKDDTVRLMALVSYVLKELIYNSGNSYVLRTELYEKISNYIQEELEHNKFNEVLEILQKNKKIRVIDNQIFDERLYNWELDLAKEIVLLLKDERNKNKKMDTFSQEEIASIYNIIEKESSIKFNEEQVNAITSAFTEPMIIITGGPGTGKTTIIHAIIKMYLKLYHDSSSLADAIALLAPTGRAAKRLNETTKMPASTIHRFLGFTGGESYEYSRYNRTNARLIIVDESSMMDLPLAYRLITSMHEDARLIVVGDVDQLPAVGPGQVLKDLIECKEIKTIRLTHIHRQAENSSIIKLAHSINEGRIPETILEKFNDRTFIPTDNEHLSKLLVEIVQKALLKGKDINKDIQVLIPMYRGEVGITDINQKLQNLVNPLHEDQKELKVFGQVFRENDKVIQLVNHADKGIMNGDIGIINNFKYKDLKINGLTVMFDSGLVDYNLEDVEELSLAYAISIHKAQGSEFDTVIMPITTKHYIMLKRKLIYTGITRAKNSLVLIGDLKALRLGIIQIEANRKTILKDKIIEYLQRGTTINNDSKKSIIRIDDETSAFDTIGEEEIGLLTPLDFEDFKN